MKLLKTLSVIFALSACAAAADTRLMMIESASCGYCKRWHREVGDAYAITDVGIAAPLLRQDFYQEMPPDVVLKTPAVYTPTFILLEDGQEVSRIEGYPGEDFFWGLVEMMLKELPEKGGT